VERYGAEAAETMKNANGLSKSGGVTRTGRVLRRGQAGATLVEIMVVLVILLIGIFLVIRVFPEGFGILRANGNRTLATRLAEQEMTRMRGDLSSLPDGVLFGYFNQSLNGGVGGIQTQNEIDPDDLGSYLNSTPINPYYSDVNKFRLIKGEAVKIPVAVTGAFGSGSVYTCKFGPLYMNQVVGNRDNVPTNDNERALYDSFLAVTGAPMTGIPVEADSTNTFRFRNFLTNQQSYLIDYGGENDGAQIMFAPRPPTTPARANPTRFFRVTVTFDNGSGFTTQTVTVSVPDSYNPVWTSLGVTGEVVPGSDAVARSFDRIPYNGTWDSNDPYQFKLLSQNIATDFAVGADATYANLGVLAFNPAGAGYSETTPRGVQPFTAYVDYSVLDWHILREEREVPPVLGNANGTVAVRVTLRDLMRVGDPLADNTFYNGIYGGTQRSVDIDVFDLNDPTGAPLLPGDYNNGNPIDADPFTGIEHRDANGDPIQADYYIEPDQRNGTYRTGTIFVNTNRRPAGSKLRILYKAQGDWAVAVQKAYSRYETALDPNGLPASLPLRARFDAFGIAGAGETAELRFPRSDVNKSFVVTLEYTLANGEVKRLAPIQMTADEPPVDGNPVGPYDGRYAIVNVFKHLPFLTQQEFRNAASWRVHGTVSGVSVKTRVIWRDADAPTERWRVQDMDTYLTVKPEGVY
jgi:type II secretory pathway pseudopilin PulG